MGDHKCLFLLYALRLREFVEMRGVTLYRVASGESLTFTPRNVTRESYFHMQAAGP